MKGLETLWMFNGQREMESDQGCRDRRWSCVPQYDTLEVQAQERLRFGLGDFRGLIVVDSCRVAVRQMAHEAEA